MGDIAKLVIEIQSTQIKEATAQLKGFGVAANGAVASTNKLGTATGKTSSAFLKQASLFKTVGRDMSRYMTLPLTLAAAASIKFAIDFNKSMGNVQALLPNTGDRIYELSEDVRALGKETGVAFDDISDGLYRTISVFQDGTDTVDRLNTAVKAGVAGYASTEDAVQLLASVTRAYGDTSAEAVDKVADLAFEAIRLGDTTFPALASAMQVATDRAVRLGISQEDLFAVMATLTGITGDASMVATQFRSAMDSLLNPTESMISLFSSLNVVSGEAMINQYGFAESMQLIAQAASDAGKPLQDYITRKEGITLVSRLASQQLGDYNEKLRSIINSSGAAKTAYESVTEGIAKQAIELDKVKNEIRDIVIDLGDKLLPVLLELLEDVKDLTVAWDNLNNAQKDSMIFFGKMAAVIGPVIIAFGSFLKFVRLIKSLLISITVGVGGLVVALAGAPIWAVAIAFGALSAALTPVVGGFIEWAQATIGARKENKRFLDSVAQYNEEMGVAVEITEDFISAQVNSNYINLGPSIAALDGVIMKYKEYTDVQENALEMTEKAYGSDFLTDLEGMNRSTLLDMIKDLRSFADQSSTVIRQMGKDILDDSVETSEVHRKILANNLTIYQQTTSQIEFLITALNGLNEITPNAVEPLDGKEWWRHLEDVAGLSANRIKNIYGSESVKGADFASKILDEIRSGGTLGNLQDLDTLLTRKIETRDGDTFITDRISEIDTKKNEIESIVGVLKYLLTLEDINSPFMLAGFDGATTTDASIDTLLAGLAKGYADLRALEREGITKLHNTAFTNMDYINTEMNEMGIGSTEYQKRIDVYNQALEHNNSVLSEARDLGIVFTDAEKEKEDAIYATNVAITEAIELLELLKVVEVSALDILKEGLEDLIASSGTTMFMSTMELIGAGFVNSADAVDTYADSLSNLAVTILDTASALLFQAGISTIIADPLLGAALLVASGVTKIGSGALSQYMSDQTSTTAYASGGVVDAPTYFPTSSGTGLMGEAGTEAIMPVTRTASGNLGVETSGSVNVNVYNNGGNEVTVQESDNGKMIDVLIEKKVTEGFLKGRYDGTMRRLYNTSRVGGR